MPTYRYSAIGRDGIETRGELEASSEQELTTQLKRRQLVLLSARASPVARGVGSALAASLVSELSRLVGSGIQLEKSLAIIAEDAGEPALSALASSLRQSIQRGQSLSAALQQAGRFDALMIALVRAGEASGQLGPLLTVLETHYQARENLRREIVATLAYPMILLAVSLLSLIGLATWVIPAFRDMFAEDEQKLPFATRLIFDISDVLLGWGGWWLAAAGVVATSAFFAYRRSQAFALAVHAQALRLPVLSALTARFEAANALGVLGIMLGAGVHLVPAMELAAQTVGNQVRRAGYLEAIKAVRKGVSLPLALEQVPGLPRLALRLTRIGNETGRLPEMCSRAAELLLGEARVRLNALVTALGPLIIVGLGGLVGFVVTAMMLAVFSLSDFG